MCPEIKLIPNLSKIVQFSTKFLRQYARKEPQLSSEVIFSINLINFLS